MQASRVATKLKVWVVLKGQGTVVAGPSGELYINSSGSPALATGGTGDILSGMIAAMLAQLGTEQAALAISSAVFLHGLAGELHESGQRTFVADDLLQQIGPAMQTLSPFA